MRSTPKRPAWINFMLMVILISAVGRRIIGAATHGMTKGPSAQPAEPRRPHAMPAALGVLALGSGLTAVLTYSSSNVPTSVFVLALFWFVVPLGLAHRRHDHALTQALLEERRESLTILIAKWLRWVVLGLGALIAGLYVVPVAALVYAATLPVETVSANSGSSQSLAVAIGFFGGGALAAVLYPFSAGLCEGIDGGDLPVRKGRVLRRIAGLVRWAGRRVTTPVVRFWRKPVRAVMALSWVLTAAAFVGAVYAMQGALADNHAFDSFAAAGLDKNAVAIATAVGLVVAVDVVGRVRTLCRRAATAALLVFAEFVALGTTWAAMGVIDNANATIWLLTPSVIVGLLFGLWLALLLSLAQAIAAGMTALGSRRTSRPYPETAAWCADIHAFGVSIGSQRARGIEVRTMLRLIRATRPAPPAMTRVRVAELPSLLRGFTIDWTGRFYLLCLASLPLVLAVTSLEVEPTGYVALLYVALAILALFGLLVASALFGAVVGIPESQVKVETGEPGRDGA